MLNWIAIWVGSYLFGLGGPLQSDTERQVDADLERHRRRTRSCRCSGATRSCRACTSASSSRSRRCRLLGDPEPHDARLRGPRGRLQPRGGALRRHQRRRATTSSRWRSPALRRARRRARHPRLAVPRSATHDIQVSTIGFIGIAVALLGRNTASASASRALLFGALVDRHVDAATSTRRVFQPELAGNLTLHDPGARRAVRRRRRARRLPLAAARRKRASTAQPPAQEAPHEHARATPRRAALRAARRAPSASSASCSACSRSSSRCRRSRRARRSGRSLVGLLAIACGIWAVARGERRLGWGAVAPGVVGIGLRRRSRRSSSDAQPRRRRRLVGAARLDARATRRR